MKTPKTLVLAAGAVLGVLVLMMRRTHRPIAASPLIDQTNQTKEQARASTDRWSSFFAIFVVAAVAWIFLPFILHGINPRIQPSCQWFSLGRAFPPGATCGLPWQTPTSGAPQVPATTAPQFPTPLPIVLTPGVPPPQRASRQHAPDAAAVHVDAVERALKVKVDALRKREPRANTHGRYHVLHWEALPPSTSSLCGNSALGRAPGGRYPR
jgi:hypothetical protein